MDALTPREREVLGLIARGMSNDEIADRAQLVMLAYESGLVVPGT